MEAIITHDLLEAEQELDLAMIKLAAAVLKAERSLRVIMTRYYAENAVKPTAIQLPDGSRENA
jgi:hypothetical protein